MVTLTAWVIDWEVTTSCILYVSSVGMIYCIISNIATLVPHRNI